MDTISQMLAAARECCRARKMHEAEALCQTILRSEPESGDAWRLLAAIAQQTGRLDRAIEYGQLAAHFMPDSAEVLSDLGSALLERGRVDEAVAVFRNAVALQPTLDALHFNLGNALKAQKQYDEASACYRRAIELNPKFEGARCNLAALHQERGQFQDAMLACRDLLFQAPNHAYGWTILGNVYKSIDQIENASDAYQRALAIQPDLIEALTGLASLCDLQGRFEEVFHYCHRALELRPDNPIAHNHLGTALENTGHLSAALACFDKAVELKPDYVDPRVNRAVLWLMAGDYERGWSEYEWRWKTRELQGRSFDMPPWEGEQLANRSIVLHAEQGFGDTIQFVRYAALVKQLGAQVIVECQRPLVKLLASCRGIDQLLALGEATPPCDFHAPLLSLPRIFRTSADTIPADVPYLSADGGLVEMWRRKLQSVRGFRIGINWHGRGGVGNHRRRDIPVKHFTQLATMAGVRLISLQQGAATHELAPFFNPQTVVDSAAEFDEQHGAFMDTAAIITNLDLVISSDTSIAHLAGALGVPVWLILPFLPDWRWQTTRSDSPWYPTMRIFRQPRPGDWQTAFGEMEAALLARDSDQSRALRYSAMLRKTTL